MRFEFMRLRVRDLAEGGGWHEVGVIVRADDGFGMTFHPRRGFESATAQVRASVERATIKGTEAEAWDYYLDRGFGMYSTFTEPDTLEADNRAAAVESLLR